MAEYKGYRGRTAVILDADEQADLELARAIRLALNQRVGLMTIPPRLAELAVKAVREAGWHPPAPQSWETDPTCAYAAEAGYTWDWKRWSKGGTDDGN